MIRIICLQNDVADAANVGGPNVETYKTFDVDLHEVEAWLRSARQWETRSFRGIEILEPRAALDGNK